jgi:hypothetical protein
MTDANGFSLKACLLAVVSSALISGGARLISFGHASNEAIMSSVAGLLVFAIIALSLFGLLGSIRYKLWWQLPLMLFCLVGGVMWVVPFPR